MSSPVRDTCGDGGHYWPGGATREPRSCVCGEKTMQLGSGPVYDLDRAARAGGFEDDLELGRKVARAFREATNGRKRFSEVLDAAIPPIAELWHDGAGEDPMWLAAMSDALGEMWTDLWNQRAEAVAASAGKGGGE